MIELTREDFLSQYPPLYCLNTKDIHQFGEKENIHLYIHIPFCVKKCAFCYYKSFQFQGSEVLDEYISYLVKEMELYSSMEMLGTKKVRSIYLGGGTPSLMTIPQYERVVTAVKDNFCLADELEFTSELSPNSSITYEKMQGLKELGITRLSIGCQSLDDRILKANGRTSSPDEFYKVYECARKVDFPVVNVDIMTGMVAQSKEDWLETVNKICKLKPENIAIYKMEIYLNNELYKRYRRGEFELISDKEEIEYAKEGYQKIIDAGYFMMDNFSFALQREQDHIHRRNVWLGEDMLGIGLSSHSCFNNFLYQNYCLFDRYYEAIDQGKVPIFRGHKITKREEMTQRIIFGIKSLSILRKDFYNEFGIDCVDLFSKEFKFLEKEGFIEIGSENIKTTISGALFADDIVRIFFEDKYKDKMLAHIKRNKVDVRKLYEKSI